MKIFFCSALVTIAALTGCSTVQQTDSSTPSMQTSQRFQGKITRPVKLDYLVFLPERYKAKSTNQWPLMLFLHGVGESGTNLSKVTANGPPKIVKTKKDFPF